MHSGLRKVQVIRLSPGNRVKLQKIVRDQYGDCRKGRRDIYAFQVEGSVLRNLKRNTQKLWYANYVKDVHILDENGDDTGDCDSGYSSPVSFYASLSASRGTAYADVFGTNLDYTRTLSTVENLPITEESYLEKQTGCECRWNH